MQAMLELSIIIVNWNSAEFVRRCVSSIRRQTSGLTYEIIVIDNASFDDCDKVLREYFPEVICLQSHVNLGFAKANNLAFEISRGASLLFLNPDTEIVGPSIFTLHRALHQLPGTGVVGAQLLNRDGSLQISCIQSSPTIMNQVLGCDYLLRRWPAPKLWGTAARDRPGDPEEEVEMVSGACLMIKREVFERVGRFSEDYFMYAEDADLCHKVRCAGWKNNYVPQATVVHFGGSSSKQAVSNLSAVMLRESIWRFLRKTRGRFYGFVYRVSILFAASGRLGLLAISFPIQVLRHRQQAAMASICKWWAILQWSLGGRARVKNFATVSPPTAEAGPMANAFEGKALTSER